MIIIDIFYKTIIFNIGCYNCGEDGHQSKDCPNPEKPKSFILIFIELII